MAENIENRVNKAQKNYTTIGGQALIEGVMMRGRRIVAISVRKPDGDIETKIEKLNPIFSAKFFKLPIIRGMFALIDAMAIGVKAITYSAEMQSPEEFEKGKFELFLEKKFGKKAEKLIMVLSVVFSLFLAVFLFGMLPSFVISLLKPVVEAPLMLSLLEGVLKLFMFIAYIFAISRMKEIRRVFQYHGAEHKTIFCFESGMELNADNAISMPRLHPRCGTSFLVYVMAISIVMFSFITWSSVGVRVLLKVITLPLVSGLAYEVIKFSSKYPDNAICSILQKPGLAMQKLTTYEPDRAQIEVAVQAMKVVLEDEELAKKEKMGKNEGHE